MEPTTADESSSQHQKIRWLRLASAGCAALALCFFFFWFPRGSDPVARPSSPSTNAEPPLRARKAPAVLSDSLDRVSGTGGSHTTRSVPAPPDQLIRRLSLADQNSARIPADERRNWKEAYTELLNHGTAAIPAISEFLRSNVDVSLDELGGVAQVGYSSTRAALLAALGQMQTPEATQALAGALRTTADPGEVTTIARYLDEQAPGLFRSEIASAATDTLEQIARDPGPVRDTAPLFQLIQEHGDARAAETLARIMPQWHHYATMALAAIPDGQGVSTLIGRVQESVAAGSIQNTFGLQMLAQAAGSNPEAAAALVEEVRQNHIPERAWPSVVDGLAGDQYQVGDPPSLQPNAPPVSGQKRYHIDSGNQTFFSTPFNPAADAAEAARRLAVADQMLGAAKDAAAVDALSRIRAALTPTVR